MKTKHLLYLLSIVALCSCSSAFRTGQTPDDVYYSPAPPPPVEYVTTDNQQDRDRYSYNNTFNSEDLAIRRGINDPRYRSSISLDLGYGYSPYDYYGSSLYAPYTPYYSPYGSFYNPYSYTGVTFYPHGYNYNYYGAYSPYYSNYSPFNYYYPPVYNSVPASNYRTGPRTFNLGVYNNGATNRTNARQQQTVSGTTMPVRTITPKPASGSGVGNFIRRVIAPSNNNRSYSSDNDNNRSYRNDNNNNSSPTRTIQSGTSSSGGSSSSGSTSAPVRTFR